MAKSPLILAALAKAAVPHLDFHEVKSLSANSTGDFDSALLTATSGQHFVIRVANSPAAGTEQETEARALKALTGADRMRLPFAITNQIGEVTDDRGNKTIISEFIYGNPTDVATVGADSPLSKSIGKAIAAIHNLDVSIVENAHLPAYDVTEIARARVAELDRAAATGRVPSILLSRWEAALEDISLFHFKPCLVHGNLHAETVLNLDNQISGVLGWHGMKIADPAEDFAWILSAGIHEVSDSIIDVYRQHHYGVDDTLRVRATLYGELDIARWLLHGTTRKDQAIIDDAVALLDGLAEDVSTGAVGRLAAKRAPAFAAAAPVAIEVIETIETTSFIDTATKPIDVAGAAKEDELF